MQYKCQQCGSEATVRGRQAIDEYESPYIKEYVICEACQYTISKDAADRNILLAACKEVTLNIERGYPINACVVLEHLQAAIALAESDFVD